ncbi:hypothetical protein MAR_035795 [Mya arenaria]|uniref:Cadherin domain-containing protein n=1 Tax=Mya arenaria TaxID=6604 RepID=A0ABY7EP43_MYAAR|nr:hypothetical protein MAR_035795 [Mya arenaria]
MDFRGFTACAIIALCLIKQSDAQITAWTALDSAGDAATVTVSGTDGTVPVSVVESTAVGGTLFTVTATGNSATYGYTFATDGNPSTLGAIAASTSGAVTLAAGKSFDYETTKTHVFKIIATDAAAAGNVGTATITVTITDTAEFTKYAFCLSSSSVTAGSSVGTLVTDQSSPTFTAATTVDFASFTIDTATGAITVATGVTLEATTQTYYTFTTTAAATGVTTSPATSVYVLINCSSDSGAGQVASLLGVLLLSVATALFY